MADFLASRFSSNSVEWVTPSHVFDPLNKEFHFTLDVCATHQNAKCKRYFTKEVDGLLQHWEGACWMNPPYGKDMVKWLLKAKQSSSLGATVVALIPARTNTAWWHDIIIPNCEIRFIRGRPKFNGAKHGLPFPLAIAIFHPKTS